MEYWIFSQSKRQYSIKLQKMLSIVALMDIMEQFLLMVRPDLERHSLLQEEQRDMLIEVSYQGLYHIFLEELDQILLINIKSMLAT